MCSMEIFLNKVKTLVIFENSLLCKFSIDERSIEQIKPKNRERNAEIGETTRRIGEKPKTRKQEVSGKRTKSN